MKKILLIAFAITFIFSATAYAGGYMRISYRYYCTEKADRQGYSESFLKCVFNANPKSDEEPEDWIPKCAEYTREAWCPLVKGVLYRNSAGYETNWVPWELVPKKHQEELELVYD